eukprot:TRINITY_DN1891_c0_g1_i1.p1 TRINITY_DN1891_c0_g1~~TRINITY_DN1891_c0_g1_i1.p1  ORF type:complete len:148 (-),score=54.59 TRINITY_DN1891_c0_g1_i1:314-757(-)
MTSAKRREFSEEEITHRHAMLTKCFKSIDLDHDGIISGVELETVARCFNPESSGASIDQEVKIVLAKLDKNHDGRVDLTEWVTVLFEIFQFMNLDAFDKHCEELIVLVKNNGQSQFKVSKDQRSKTSDSSSSSSSSSSSTSSSINSS